MRSHFDVCFQDNVGLRGIFAGACAILTLPVFGLLAFTYVPPLVSTIWLGITYSFAAVSSSTVSPMAKAFLLAASHLAVSLFVI